MGPNATVADAAGAAPRGPRFRKPPSHSRMMTLRIRHPSRTACRLLAPKMRGDSWLGTSWIFRPALAARMFISVSTSKPGQLLTSMAPR